MFDPLRLSVDGHELTFEQVPLHFMERGGISDVFADYKAKTLRETLRKKHYKNLVRRSSKETFLIGIRICPWVSSHLD